MPHCRCLKGVCWAQVESSRRSPQTLCLPLVLCCALVEYVHTHTHPKNPSPALGSGPPSQQGPEQGESVNSHKMIPAVLSRRVRTIQGPCPGPAGPPSRPPPPHNGRHPGPTHFSSMDMTIGGSTRMGMGRTTRVSAVSSRA